MPFELESLQTVNPKNLRHREKVSERRQHVSRVIHVGRTLLDLDKEERAAKRAWRDCEGVESPVERADAMAKLAKVLDTIRDRRRILLGEPLPGTRRQSEQRMPFLRNIVDVQPESLPGPESISPTEAQGPVTT